MMQPADKLSENKQQLLSALLILKLIKRQGYGRAKLAFIKNECCTSLPKTLLELAEA
jgi:hypothetical protein